MTIPFPTQKPISEIFFKPIIKKTVPCSRNCETIVRKSPWMYCNCTKNRKMKN